MSSQAAVETPFILFFYFGGARDMLWSKCWWILITSLTLLYPFPFLPPTSRHLVAAHHSSSLDFQEKGKEIYCLKWFAGGKSRVGVHWGTATERLFFKKKSVSQYVSAVTQHLFLLWFLTASVMSKGNTEGKRNTASWCAAHTLCLVINAVL